jgi:hypothetical protein
MTAHVALITSPAASIPGALVALIPTARNGRVVGMQLRHAEWTNGPCSLAIPRVSALLTALDPMNRELRREVGGSPDDVRLLVCRNFWFSADTAMREAGLAVASFVTITPGGEGIDGPVHDRKVGRLALIDLLRDRLPLLHLTLPEQRLDSHPQVVAASELRDALRTIQARPRLLDAETEAPGLDREDVLVLALAMAVQDSERTGGGTASAWDPRVSPNVAPSQPVYGYHRR